MRHLPDLLSRFHKDERGAFAMIFAVASIALIAMAGAAVDFTGLEQARTNAQVALDAAALALQPSIYTPGADIQGQALALLKDQLSSSGVAWKTCDASNTAPCATVSAPVIDTVNGQLTLTANLQVPTSFVTLVGVTKIPAQIVSVATRKKLSLEVAMVLDNSGSMYYTMGYNYHVNNTLPTRMQTLQTSAVCATNILFYGVTTCSQSTSGATQNPNVKMGLVPFTQAVNVGPSNANASWIDRGGRNNITNNNFDNDDYDNNGSTSAQVDTFTGPVDRIALFSQMKSSAGTAMSWGGCVEARKAPYDTDNTPASTANPDTLFTPYFAPDEPDSGGFSNNYIADAPANCPAAPKVVWTQTKTKCSYAASGYSAAYNYNKWCNGPTTNSYVETDYYGTVTNTTSIPSTIYNNPSPSSSSSDVYQTSGSGTNITNTRISTYVYNFSPREYQERLCKYNGGQMTRAASLGNVFGPNGDCPAASVLPLSSSPSSVISAIKAMSPAGGTNITEGAAWGMRTLSPDDPFPANAFDTATSKVMIIMTDGENTIYPGSNMNYDEAYSAYGYPWNNRLTSSTSSSVLSNSTTLAGYMNTRLATVCTNAKNLGITVYTIGVDVADTSDPSGNTALLRSCATEQGDAYFPNTAADLQAAFVSIASQLAALRIAQ